jgi:hypothetical protein
MRQTSADASHRKLGERAADQHRDGVQIVLATPLR